MKRKLGAIGKYPLGSYGRGDEGELSMAVTTNSHGDVEVRFGKPVAWFAIPPKQAIALANLLLKHAGVKMEIGMGGD